MFAPLFCSHIYYQITIIPYYQYTKCENWYLTKYVIYGIMVLSTRRELSSLAYILVL